MPMSPRLLRPLSRFQAPAPPFATLVSTKSTGNVSGLAETTTGYIKVEWWDNTTNVYGNGSGGFISWSKAVGGAGGKTIKIYPSDVGGNIYGAMLLLRCNNNQITSLDVSGLTSLSMLDCSLNALTSIRAVGCLFTGYVSSYYGNYFGGCSLYSNQLSADALNQLYADVAVNPGPQMGLLLVGQNPGTNTSDRSIATSKGYVVYG